MNDDDLQGMVDIANLHLKRFFKDNPEWRREFDILPPSAKPLMRQLFACGFICGITNPNTGTIH